MLPGTPSIAKRWKASQRLANVHGGHFKRPGPWGPLGATMAAGSSQRGARESSYRCAALRRAPRDRCRRLPECPGSPWAQRGRVHFRLRDVAKGMGQQSSNAAGSEAHFLVASDQEAGGPQQQRTGVACDGSRHRVAERPDLPGRTDFGEAPECCNPDTTRGPSPNMSRSRPTTCAGAEDYCGREARIRGD